MHLYNVLYIILSIYSILKSKTVIESALSAYALFLQLANSALLYSMPPLFKPDNILLALHAVRRFVAGARSYVMPGRQTTACGSSTV